MQYVSIKRTFTLISRSLTVGRVAVIVDSLVTNFVMVRDWMSFSFWRTFPLSSPQISRCLWDVRSRAALSSVRCAVALKY